ncbi:MAG: putative porin [Oleispira sp.]|nr:putative porin [Oleispira sp.]MBL4880858.1 putative porin [Oleispira sp.]
MKKILLGATIALLSSSVVYAQDYQFEIGAQYINGDNGDDDFDGYGLNAQLHLDVVDTSKGPLNEAAFLDKSSYVDLAWSTTKLDVSGADSSDTTTIGGRFVTSSNIIIEADYTDLEDDSTYSIGAGTYISEKMEVVATYQTADKADVSSFAVDLHGLNPLQGETAVAFDAGLAYVDLDGDSAYRFSAAADYYFNNALSIGAGAAFVSADDFDTSAINVRADYFVTPIARLGLAFTSLGQDADGQNIQLNAAVRF